MTELIHQDLTFAIIGAAMEVHRELGPGFLESIYQAAMEVELRTRQIRFESQKRIAVAYREVSIGDHVLDLVVHGQVVVELKAVKDLNDQHRAQILSYLKASGLPVGLLINFAKVSLEHKRLVLSDGRRSA
ncbi:MAG: GxxExxY protein [Deltaproteobacteria bacterium]|nr:GxxExxY protein [Deltaproteobacteria bacterium]MBI3388264.1 GxxExxY protein [Deltaproteobacteria bacterium]